MCAKSQTHQRRKVRRKAGQTPGGPAGASNSYIEISSHVEVEWDRCSSRGDEDVQLHLPESTEARPGWRGVCAHILSDSCICSIPTCSTIPAKSRIPSAPRGIRSSRRDHLSAPRECPELPVELEKLNCNSARSALFCWEDCSCVKLLCTRSMKT